MKNIIFKVFIASLLLSSFNSIGQTKDDYINGYKDGFRVGYCLNTVNCSAPIPNSRSIFIGDRPLQYPIGYAQGLEDGKQKRINDENIPLKTQSQIRKERTNKTDNKSSTTDAYLEYQKRRDQINKNYRSSARNSFLTSNRGFGIGIAYDVGFSGSLDFFFDTWMFGIGYGSREKGQDDYGPIIEDKVFGTIGYKLGNRIYLKGGFGQSYDDGLNDYTNSYSDDLNESSYFQIGLQGFFPSGNNSITPELFYSNVSGSIGFGIGFIF